MRLRNLLLSTVLVAGAGVAPAAAADLFNDVGFVEAEESPFSGNLGIWGQVVWPSHYFDEDFGELDPCDEEFDGDDFCRTAFGFGGHARALYRLDDSFNIQFELLGEHHTSMNNEEDDDEEHMATMWLAAGGHLIFRDSNFAYGGFGGVSATASMADDEHPVHVFGGVEAAAFMDVATVFGQVGGVVLADGDDTLGSMVFGRAGARLYVTPNSVFEASAAAGYSPNYDSDDDTPETAKWVQAAIEYEHRFDQSPFSVFAGYQADFIWSQEPEGDCCDESVVASTFKVGVRMHLDEDTLQGADVRGARTFAFPNLRAPLSYAAELN